ncbi:DUF1990 domain-containing protein [Actinomycetes bacterium KLBMP 9797]
MTVKTRPRPAMPWRLGDYVSVGFFDDQRRLATLASAELTYREHGATRQVLPAGYTHLHREVPIATGRLAFATAANALLTWQMHRTAGITVSPSHPTAEPGVVVAMRLGWGPVSLGAPCRVVYRVQEPDIQGFAYGTLPGHPEQGEEAFLIQRGDDETVRLTIRAFSRPASTLARLGGPLTRRAQAMITERYVQALRHLTRTS